MTANGWRTEALPHGSTILDAFPGLLVMHPSGVSISHRVGDMYACIRDADGQLVDMVRPDGPDEHRLGRTLVAWLQDRP